MKISEVSLPSNKKFGLFFTAIFLVITGYFYAVETILVAYTFLGITLTFFVVTLIKADALFILNRSWMYLGLLLGKIVSPIVLGILFFGLFTPIALLMKLFRRDELRLRIDRKSNHWIQRDHQVKPNSFKNQF